MLPSLKTRREFAEGAACFYSREARVACFRDQRVAVKRSAPRGFSTTRGEKHKIQYELPLKIQPRVLFVQSLPPLKIPRQ